MYVLSVTANTAYSQLQPHLGELVQICSAALQDKQNHMVPFYAIKYVHYLKMNLRIFKFEVKLFFFSER